jgi:hypothetical protein
MTDKYINERKKRVTSGKPEKNRKDTHFIDKNITQFLMYSQGKMCPGKLNYKYIIRVPCVVEDAYRSRY